jgi:hypothetical protein
MTLFVGTLNVILVIWYKNPLDACVSSTTILIWWPKFHIDCDTINIIYLKCTLFVGGQKCNTHDSIADHS